MNVLSKNLKSALTGTSLLFLIGSITPALADSITTNQDLIAQSPVIAARSAEEKILALLD